MPLQDLDLKISYRSHQDDLIADFLVPCLEQATEYRRSAGYFSSAGLALAARGVASLASRGGCMKLVASPHLMPDDVEALTLALKNPTDVLRGITARSLVAIEDALMADRLNALAWLAAAGLLEVKIAFRLNDDGQVSRGIYHEKSGIFSDETNFHITFSGSSNETAGGLLENFESVKVFASDKDAERVTEEITNFEALWNNETNGLRIVDFTEVSRELLEIFRDPDNPPPGLTLPEKVNLPPAERPFSPPAGFELRDCQARAWIKNGGRGILAMATGS
ncbi:MAG: phospholipase D-like domain-containing protein [Verrucomicrobiales bacterium]|nr:phospholipase D-like domain-containing protein [Verrucomicrobiales bacterium]